MFKIISLIPEAWKKILRNRHVVYFDDAGVEGSAYPDRFSEKYFRVKRTQQINYDLPFYLSGKDGELPQVDVDFEDDDKIGLYPNNTWSLYEILIGMKSSQGSVLAYPLASINQYLTTLEEGGFRPNTASDAQRYIGAIEESDTPADKPQLRYHTVADLNSIGLRLFNDSLQDDKVVLKMLVNRCYLEEVPEKNLSQKEKDRVREITHYDLEARGGW